MNDNKRTWTTPKLTPLEGESADGALITAMWMGVFLGGMQAGEAKTNVGGSETRSTGRMNGMTYYSHTGPS